MIDLLKALSNGNVEELNLSKPAEGPGSLDFVYYKTENGTNSKDATLVEVTASAKSYSGSDYIKCPKYLYIHFPTNDSRCYLNFYTKKANGDYEINWEYGMNETASTGLKNYMGNHNFKFFYNKREDLYIRVGLHKTKGQGVQAFGWNGKKCGITATTGLGYGGPLNYYDPNNPKKKLSNDKICKISLFSSKGGCLAVLPANLTYGFANENVIFHRVFGAWNDSTEIKEIPSIVANKKFFNMTNERKADENIKIGPYRYHEIRKGKRNETGNGKFPDRDFDFYIASIRFLKEPEYPSLTYTPANSKTSVENTAPITYVGDITDYCVFFTEDGTITNSTLSDKARSNIQQAKEICDLSWTVESNNHLDCYYTRSSSSGRTTHLTYKKGVQYNGIPYSSEWKTPHYVGWHISPYTFLSALKYPNSIMYNDRILSSSNCETFLPYGLVCSSFAALAAGWPYPQTNAGFLYDPQISITETESPPAGSIYSNVQSTASTHCVLIEDYQLVNGETVITNYEATNPATTRATRRYNASALANFHRVKLEGFYNNYKTVPTHINSKSNKQLFSASATSEATNRRYGNFKLSATELERLNKTAYPFRLYKGDKSTYTNHDDIFIICGSSSGIELKDIFIQEVSYSRNYNTKTETFSETISLKEGTLKYPFQTSQPETLRQNTAFNLKEGFKNKQTGIYAVGVKTDGGVDLSKCQLLEFIQLNNYKYQATYELAEAETRDKTSFNFIDLFEEYYSTTIHKDLDYYIYFNNTSSTSTSEGDIFYHTREKSPVNGASVKAWDFNATPITIKYADIWNGLSETTQEKIKNSIKNKPLSNFDLNSDLGKKQIIRQYLNEYSSAVKNDRKIQRLSLDIAYGQENEAGDFVKEAKTPKFWYAAAWCEGLPVFSNVTKITCLPCLDTYESWFANGCYVRQIDSIFCQGVFGAYLVPVVNKNIVRT